MSSNQQRLQKINYFSVLLANDSKGIEQIYEQYFASINKLISKFGGNTEDAQDIFQEALIIIYQKGQSEDFKITSSFFTLLYSICRNLWRSLSQKKYKKDFPILHIDKFHDENNIEKDILDNEIKQLFLDHFKNLPKDAQIILQMYLEGKSMNQIKEKMGFKTANYASKRKLHAKNSLLNFIKEDPRYIELKN